jgi:hypothetical protein
MNRPPCLARIKVAGPENRFGLWLPLFLLAPLFYLLLLVLTPLLLIAALVAWPFGWGKPLLMVVPTILRCLHAMRGLEVNVVNGKEKVSISVK